MGMFMVLPGGGTAEPPAGGRAGRGGRWWVLVAVVLVAVVTTAAPALVTLRSEGAISRGDLDREVQSRGGGIGRDLALDAVDASPCSA
jgi:hypothetical protein